MRTVYAYEDGETVMTFESEVYFIGSTKRGLPYCILDRDNIKEAYQKTEGKVHAMYGDIDIGKDVVSIYGIDSLTILTSDFEASMRVAYAIRQEEDIKVIANKAYTILMDYYNEYLCKRSTASALLTFICHNEKLQRFSDIVAVTILTGIDTPKQFADTIYRAYFNQRLKEIALRTYPECPTGVYTFSNGVPAFMHDDYLEIRGVTKVPYENLNSAFKYHKDDEIVVMHGKSFIGAELHECIDSCKEVLEKTTI